MHQALCLNRSGYILPLVSEPASWVGANHESALLIVILWMKQ